MINELLWNEEGKDTVQSWRDWQAPPLNVKPLPEDPFGINKQLDESKKRLAEL